MAEEIKKNDGPSCACGKGDLYEEWLKNENKKKDDADATNSKEIKKEKKADSNDS